MKFDLADIDQANSAFEYLTKLTGKETVAEVKKIDPKRSLSQNAYLHLLLGAFGAHFGYTIPEAKLVYKDLNADVYRYSKRGRNFMKSSAELDSAEMTKTIDRFREASAEQGCPLPLPDQREWLMSIENSVEQSNMYL